jgi:branched-chain amino acid transport system permease protein
MGAAQLLQYLMSGIATGGVYAVVAIGFSIIYNATGIINFAQGEFLMLGGMIAISLTRLLPLPLAIIAAVAMTGLAGVVLQLVFLSWLKSPTVLRMIIITIGLSILLREAGLHIWDEKVHALPFFSGDETSSISLLGARVSPQVLWVLGLCALMVVSLAFFFRSTLLGKAMRACASNPTAARLCGIRASTVVTFSFFLAAAMGALAGCAMSPLTQTRYDMGSSLAVKGFTCAVLGGLGSIPAAVAAGLVVGVLEAASVSVLPLAYKDVVALGILLGILFIRPEGLFSRRRPPRPRPAA